MKFIVDQVATPRLADTGVGDSPTHRCGESGSLQKENKSLRSLCVPAVAGISGPAKNMPVLKTKNLGTKGYLRPQT